MKFNVDFAVIVEPANERGAVRAITFLRFREISEKPLRCHSPAMDMVGYSYELWFALRSAVKHAVMEVRGPKNDLWNSFFVAWGAKKIWTGAPESY